MKSLAAFAAIFFHSYLFFFLVSLSTSQRLSITDFDSTHLLSLIQDKLLFLQTATYHIVFFHHNLVSHCTNSPNIKNSFKRHPQLAQQKKNEKHTRSFLRDTLCTTYFLNTPTQFFQLLGDMCSVIHTHFMKQRYNEVNHLASGLTDKEAQNQGFWILEYRQFHKSTKIKLIFSLMNTQLYVEAL